MISAAKRNREIKKEDVMEAGKFLQNQQQKLSQMESSLPPLVDMLLGNGSKNGMQTANNVRMNMADLASTCRHLHALQAKQLLHLESTLVAEYGYVTASQMREEEDENSGYVQDFDEDEENDGYGDVDIDGNYQQGDDMGKHLNQPLTPNWMARSNSQADQFQSTCTPYLDQRLPRLSEATLETDGGTPGSVLTLERASASISPPEGGNYGTNTAFGNGNGRRASIMSLKSLVEEESDDESGAASDVGLDVDMGVTYDSESDNDLSYASEKENNNEHDGTPTQKLGAEEDVRRSLTPKTPSIADIKLRYVRSKKLFDYILLNLHPTMCTGINIIPLLY